ncbi:MAG: hypothetical protein EOP85_09050, partial [Verrucomicrobiaceae bacterium]
MPFPLFPNSRMILAMSHLPARLTPLMAAAVLAATSASHAALEADFVTTRGTVTVELEHAKAPKAVASLITLSQGTRSWLEPVTGSVRREPFYQGLPFDAVTNTPSAKQMEVGVADCGYQFQDEFDPTLLHEPYVLSMSNDGPNTNGASLTFTGSTALSGRNNVHTVFGKIPDSASRTVIDSILSAGPGATTVTDVVIRRTDASAVAFNEHAVPIPHVEAVNGPLQVIPGGAVNLLFPQPAISVLRASTSTDLAAWQPRFQRFSGLDDTPAGPTTPIDSAVLPKQFYQISVARYPDIPEAGGPSDFANRTLSITGGGTGTITYEFDATGRAGTYQNILQPGNLLIFEGDFQVRDEVPAVFGPYSFRVLIHAENLGGSPFNLIRGGIDTVNSGDVTGRRGHTRSAFSEMGDGQESAGPHRPAHGIGEAVHLSVESLEFGQARGIGDEQGVLAAPKRGVAEFRGRLSEEGLACRGQPSHRVVADSEVVEGRATARRMVAEGGFPLEDDGVGMLSDERRRRHSGDPSAYDQNIQV